MLHVAALSVELHLPSCHSLKDKRAVIRPVLDGARHRYGVAAAEVDHQEKWQLSGIGLVAVSGSAGHTARLLDAVERFVWSFPELEVVASRRDWMEHEGAG